MAKIQYTPAQNAAICWRGGNLLLSAAAGSGKTATLTGRILWLLTHEDVSIREMCIVTYTRAAAAELRERIAARLREQVQETGSRRLVGQLAELSGAEISTIHAFLYRNLRPLFSALGLSPDFVIGDEPIMAQLRAEAMAEITDECFDRGEADFLTLADTLSAARDTETLDKTLLEIDRALSSAGKTPNDLQVYATALSDIDTDMDFFRLPQSEPLKLRLSATLSHFRITITETRMAFSPEVETKYGPSADAFLDWLHRIENALAGNSYAAVRNALSDSRLPRLATIQAKNATAESIRFKELRDEGKKALETLHKSLFFFDPAQIPTVCSRTAALLTALSAVLAAYEERYRMKKRTKGLLDYGDLESYALSLFLDKDGNPTPTAVEVGRKYKYIFIDEYQDTNDVQDAIFRSISTTARRFLVGDVKQSIYRFRGAEPAVFSRYRDCWTVLSPKEAADRTEENFAPEEGYSLFMSENFRCDRAVIELTNLVSSLLFPYGAISYSDADALLLGKSESGDEAAEICLIKKPSRADAEEEDSDEETERSEDTEEDPEAAYVAERIRDYLTHGLPDGTPVMPEDVAILLRSPESSGEKYRTALAKRHIPVTSPNADPLFVSPAVLLALCMAYTADNPLRDIYTAGALHSPLFGLTTAELTAVHRQSPETPLYIAVELAVHPESAPVADVDFPVSPASSDIAKHSPSAETVDKLKKFLAALPEMRTWARTLTADRFFERLFAAYRFYDLPEVAEDPTEARNLQSLYDLSRKHGSGGISAFLQVTETLRDNARMENESVSGVTLTSIHKSKGLEYPIVIVPECAKKRNARDESAGILFDGALGFGLRLPDDGGLVRCDTILRSAIAEKKRTESVAEEMRILYVALTRARTKLICTAKVRDPEAFVEKYRAEADYPTSYRITTANTYIEWLLLASFSDLPSRLREIHLITPGIDHPSAWENALPDTPEDSFQPLENPIEMPDAPAIYPTPEYAAIPTKVSVSALHPGVVDEWLRQGGIAVRTEESSMDDPYNAQAPSAFDPDGEESTPGTISSADDAAKEDVPLSEDVITKAISNRIPLPRFLTGMDEIRTPADRGTATHMFLQFADFDRLWKTDVDRELSRLTEAHYLTAETARLAYRGQLAQFRESALFRRMRESREIHREFRFNAELPAARFTDNPVLRDKLTADGIVLTVQGVVDCVFREPDGTLTLVDYKTDHATAADRADPAAFADKLRIRHRNQLVYYREICEKLFSEPIRTVLYATAVGGEFPIV